MRSLKVVSAVLVCLVLSSVPVAAAPLTLTLVQTSILYNEDPPGAPLPLARRQYDAGNIMLQERKIGEYLRVKEVHSNTFNVAAVSITLFFPSGTDLPGSVTLQGAHTFVSGDESGSISASSFPGISGVGFTYDGATGSLTLLFP